MYNNSKIEYVKTKKKSPDAGQKESEKMNKEQKKIRETLLELKRVSLRYRRQANFVLSMDIHDPERHRRWYEIGKERDRRYHTLFRVLYHYGIDALKLKIFY